MPNQIDTLSRTPDSCLRVLVVGADPLAAAVLRLGHEIVRSQDSELRPFDLAFVDLSTGAELVAKLKSSRSPLIAVVEAMTAEKIDSARAVGFDDVIPRDFTHADLVAKLAIWSPLEKVSSRFVLDPASIGELEKLQLEDGSGLVPTLIRLFIASRKEIDLLREAFSAGDLDTARALAHDLKSACANLGLVRMKCVCHKIELSETADDMRVAVALLPMQFELAKIHLERAKLASLPKSA
ncbi:MAG: Hpt domain-containing protein [Bdellovibrionota bacterium]